ncbi:MAG: SUMF1/EgtB/PvdO family nonheme iron enzyme [Nitrospinaceae bacterium]|nr:formylglycine-generating enzyme family protein [Nitrospinaceae bacterium]NIX34134.1 SUMF1/EgtB/PvdO family nonheme iron enzyme [Nitrospinaceae bacterium]
MALIPAGRFVMGADPGEGYRECYKYAYRCERDYSYSDESAHTVELGSFYMDQYEVTQADYERVMRENPSSFKGSNHPVDKVTWLEAKGYCEQVGKRLPTEAEWERAARGGTQTAYYWGNSMKDDYAWYSKNSAKKTHPVGQKKPNAYGLYDMAGNAWEWVSDWYVANYYRNAPRVNPQGPNYGDLKVLRGGSWTSDPTDTRAAARDRKNPIKRYNGIGFRCAKSK